MSGENSNKLVDDLKDGVEEELKQEAKSIDLVEDNINQEREKIDNIEESSEDIKEQKVKKLSSHDEIVKRVEATKELAESKYKEYIDAEQSLEEIIEDFINQENSIVDTTISTSLELLDRLGVDSLSDEKAVVNEIQKENKEELITIKKPSKGSGKGFFVGLLGTIATVGGALYYGTKMASLPLNSATLMQKSNLDLIATKYSELINIKGTLPGYALIGVSALVVGYILYKIVTIIQKSKNSKYTEKIEEDTKEYISNLDNKIAKIGELGEHIEHIKLVMQKYDIILQEQNAKIRRMLFIEQPVEGVDSLQRASKLEVEKTVLIIDELLKLMNTPVNEDVDIRDESRDRLNSANSVINEVIKKLYI